MTADEDMKRARFVLEYIQMIGDADPVAAQELFQLNQKHLSPIFSATVIEGQPVKSHKKNKKRKKGRK